MASWVLREATHATWWAAHSLRFLCSLGVAFHLQADNILKVELDMPNRTTRDYKAPAVKSSLQAALDIALQEEEEMVFDALCVHYYYRCQLEKRWHDSVCVCMVALMRVCVT